MITWLSECETPRFPDPESDQIMNHGLSGLLAAGGKLDSSWLLSAYKQGIFPWFSEDQPILWWCPNPRMVLFTNEIKISESLKKKLKTVHNNPDWTIAIDRNFMQVIQSCAAPRPGQDGTWINPEIIHSYVELHHLGIAHSVETYYQDQLVGGLYGLAIGKMFYGESMFTRKTDASKLALVKLTEFLRDNQVSMIDCQQNTPHLASMGAREISRKAFLEHIAHACEQTPVVNWALD